jgi:acyl-CoA thioesterase YciA
MSESHPVEPAIRVTLMPRDTNVHGTIFGGVILSYIDLAGAIAARPFARGRLVTVAMKEVEFHQPVFVGDVVSFYAEVLRRGTTSITVRIRVLAQRFADPGETVAVTEAEVVYVSVDESGRKTPLRPPAGP